MGCCERDGVRLGDFEQRGSLCLCEPDECEEDVFPRRRPGRKPLGETPSVCLALRVERTMLARVDEAARAVGMSRSAYVRAALGRVLEAG